MRKMILCALVLCALVLLPAAGFAGGALEKIHGAWVVSVAETINANPDMEQGLKAENGEEFRAMLVQELSAIKFNFNVPEKTLTTEGHEGPPATQPFEAAGETENTVDITSGGETHRITATDKGLEMGLDNGGIILLKRP